jgi:hypothetical protein
MKVTVLLVNMCAEKHPETEKEGDIPDEPDKARLLFVEVPEIKTPQFSHTVSPQDASERPIPINDHTCVAISTLIVPP